MNIKNNARNLLTSAGFITNLVPNIAALHATIFNIIFMAVQVIMKNSVISRYKPLGLQTGISLGPL